jgi:hypothetical protein
MRTLSIVLLVGALAACRPVNKPIESGSELPSDSAQVCSAHCDSLGLQMSAVVVILNSVGCVCQPPNLLPTGNPGSSAPGASASVGGAVVAAHIAAQQRAQQQQQQSTAYHSPASHH